MKIIRNAFTLVLVILLFSRQGTIKTNTSEIDSLQLNEINSIRKTADSLLRIHSIRGFTTYRTATEYDNYSYFNDPIADKLLYYKIGAYPKVYLNKQGDIILVEDMSFDDASNSAYIDEYFCNKGKPFYFRKSPSDKGRPRYDITIKETKSINAFPDNSKFKFLNSSDLKKWIDENTLSKEMLNGTWYEIEQVEDDRNYILNKDCGSFPTTIQLRSDSLSINYGQMADLYSIIASRNYGNNVILMARNVYVNQASNFEFMVSPYQKGMTSWIVNERNRIMVQEKYLDLVTIVENNEGCEGPN